MLHAALPLPATAARRARLALLLAILGVPGCTIAWDLPAGGFWIGMPLAFAAIALAAGVAGPVAEDRAARRVAIVAIALAAVEILFTATWTVAG